jgi:dATP/dGTP diphosphohydrolase
MEFIPWDSVRAILNILEVGAKKYAPRNWEQGMDWSRLLDACIRHLTEKANIPIPATPTCGTWVQHPLLDCIRTARCR